MDKIAEFINNFDWTGTSAIVLYVTLGLIYICAHVLSRKTECVILYKWYDVTCIFITAICPITISILLGISKIYNFNSVTTLKIGILVLGILPMIISYIISIIANLHHGYYSILYAFISIATKTIFLVFSPIIVISWFQVTMSGSGSVKDARFRDGTRNNEKTKAITRAVAIFVFIFYPLVFSLIKPNESKENIKYTLKAKAGI